MSFVISVDLSDKRIDPPLELEGAWEVGLLDAYLDLPHKTTHGLKHKYGKGDFVSALGELDIFFECKILKDRLTRNQAVRDAFKKYKYGNFPRKPQRSTQFDIWNYKIHDERRLEIKEIYISRVMSSYFNENPNAKVTIEEIIELLNDAIEEKFIYHIKPWLKYVFWQTGGENAIISSPYFQIPTLQIEGNIIKLNTPFYVKKIYTSTILNKLFKFHLIETLYPNYKIILNRMLVPIPSPLIGNQYIKDAEGEGGKEYIFPTEPYHIASPCKELVGFLGASTTKDPAKLFILMPDMIEETKFGNATKPLLKMMEWKDGANYTQFHNPIYSKLRYNRLGDFKIELTSEDCKESCINLKGKLTLHFRLKIEDE